MIDEMEFQKLRGKVIKLENATIQATAGLVQVSFMLNELRPLASGEGSEFDVYYKQLTERIEKLLNALDESIHAED